MVKPVPKKPASNPRNLSPERYARLQAEVKAPYRSFRKFIYFACAASGLTGAFIFLAQLVAGRDVTTALPNLALQIGVVALMVGLFRWEIKAEKALQEDSTEVD
ncbi:MAG: DUF3493 domain-containing protein [Symploca sp. SIO2G7]|nr:DUF3493 domain-containing protein [Symploca sp. SIO2G7]